jgi:hypothetical protein
LKYWPLIGPLHALLVASPKIRILITKSVLLSIGILSATYFGAKITTEDVYRKIDISCPVFLQKCLQENCTQFEKMFLAEAGYLEVLGNFSVRISSVTLSVTADIFRLSYSFLHHRPTEIIHVF